MSTTRNTTDYAPATMSQQGSGLRRSVRNSEMQGRRETKKSNKNAETLHLTVQEAAQKVKASEHTVEFFAPSANRESDRSVNGSKPTTLPFRMLADSTANVPGDDQAFTAANDPGYIYEYRMSVKHTDYRFIHPDRSSGATAEDRESIQTALELSRQEYFDRIGWSAPTHLQEWCKKESYNTQHLRIQELFAKAWSGPRPAPQLYYLPAWEGGFQKWQIPDQRGVDLYTKVVQQRSDIEEVRDERWPFEDPL